MLAKGSKQDYRSAIIMKAAIPSRWPLQGKLVSVTLTVLALLLSALAPQGFMPKYAADGFSIELCSGHANNKLATPDHPDYAMLALVYGGQEQPDIPNSETGSSVCTYAASSGVSLISATPAIALTDQVMAETQRHFAVRNRLNIPPATGPPVTI